MKGFKIISDLFLISNPVGYDMTELNKTREIFGAIPRVLEEFYINYGKSKELQGLQDELVLPDKYESFLKYDYMVFFNENQGVCQAGIHRSDLDKENPPVYVNNIVDGKMSWYKSADSISDFLIAMYGYQASICLEYYPEGFFWVSTEDIKYIEEKFEKKEQSMEYWLMCKITLYGNDNNSRIALMDNLLYEDNIQMNYASNNEKSFGELDFILENIGESM